RELPELAVDEQLDVADDGRHRRRELVRDVPVKLLLRLIELDEAPIGAGELGDLLFEVGDNALTLEEQVLTRVLRRALAPPLEVAAHRVGERARVDWLLEIPVTAHGQARFAVAFGGDGDDRDVV